MKRYSHHAGRKRYALIATLFVLLVSSTLTLHASLLCNVVGHVYTAPNVPAAGAKVELLLLGKVHATTTTDLQGRYKFEGVCFGIYDLRATLLKANALVKDVKLRLHETTTVDIYLKGANVPPPVEPVVVKEEPVPPPVLTIEKDYDAIQLEEIESNGSEVQYDHAPAELTIEPSNFYLLHREQPQPVDREGYDHIAENRFFDALQTPLTTFAIDVDEASYTNCRRMLTQENRLPSAAAVRVEEFINYFDYDYPQPPSTHPFSITTELAPCPWEPTHQLVHIGLQGKKLEGSAIPPANLVFLIDVSGSMEQHNKLPLVKQGLNLLVDQLRPQDEVALVVYAGAAGLVLPPTPGNQGEKIKDAINQLSAGGSTAGGAGIQLAYSIARQHFKQNGNNRVILCTDGDFNVGVSSDGELVQLIEKEREGGVFLSVLGFGTGNYQDAKMEKLADNGNGNYAYIDQLLEAKKVFVDEVAGTLNTIAKDVKIQVEFNPAKVKSYRLIGYENRRLENEDFDNDKKDAGDLGAGHTVTALYEVIPTESTPKDKDSYQLRYQMGTLSPLAGSNELLTVKFRYKAPDGDVSQLIEQQLMAKVTPMGGTSDNFRFAAAVAAFGMLLKGSEHKGGSTYAMARDLAKGSLGKDAMGYRAEFVRLVELAELLANQQASAR